MDKNIMETVMLNLHSCQDQKYGQVDLDDHVNVVLIKRPCSEADDNKEQSWEKHSQQVVDKRSSKSYFNNNGFNFLDRCLTHTNPTQGVLAERNVGVVLQISWMEICVIGFIKEFHLTNLAVKWIPVVFVFADPLYIHFLCQTESIF